ncbi:MAG: hypothetical protein KDA24_29760 [Deltaproteobacteria bacterium]|nr:hypothetical protein [Deltaproteobacteria bacterium]
MADTPPPSSRLRLVVALAILGTLGWWGLETYAAKQAAEQEERARIAAEIEAERAAQQETARIKRAEKAAREAAEKAARDEAEREARIEQEAALEGLRDVDKLLLLDWKGRDIKSSKRLDVTKGRPYRVAVFQGDGRREVTEAKVDLDRDDLWDERWIFEEAGRVRREVAPKDDENFTRFELLRGNQFVPEGS